MLAQQRLASQAAGAARRTTARPCLAAPTPGHVVNSRCVKVQVATTDRASATPFAPVGQTRDGDVYVNEPKRLKEGEEKHVISVFVADEAGIINRVAGVFARRAANIESLAVGLTRDKALFTIVVTGTANTIANLVKQVAKLIKVRYVEDITPVARIERELVLLKLSVPPGPERTEVLQLATIFRARVVDVAEATLTLCVSGDAGKCAAIQKVMTKFGIVEVARTGRVCLKRGEKLLEPVDYSRRSMDAMSPGPSAFTHEGREGDVYMVDDSDAPGVWEVENILESTYSSGDGSDYEAHTLSIEVKDVPGVLNMVTGVFARRGYNVQSLAVGPSEREGMSRICMVVPGAAPAIDKLVKQLNKLVDVQSVTNLTPMPFVNRELMLVKVRCGASQRGELRDLAAIFRADILDISPGTLTLEILGKEDKMKALTDLLEPYGIMEIARTGRVAVSRESGVDSKFLEQRQSQRIY
ncbi:small subunit of acetolactate synthase [Haematococcus lacustris]